MTINEIVKYYNTIKYLKPVQTTGRIYSAIKKGRSTNIADFKLSDTMPGIKNATSFIHHDSWNCRESILSGKFIFLNTEKQFAEGHIDWDPKDMPLLWRFNLNYFGYLYLLEGNEKLKICNDWIDHCPAGKTAGWHSYPLSLRIVNWIKEGMNDPAIIRSLYVQASYLFKNLEIYHPGNHLLENARALVFAGIYFRGDRRANKWYEKGIKIFKKQLPLQILSDGGYFERSIMYHALMFELILDLINILPQDDEEFIDNLLSTAGKMSIFLESMTHPDRNIALFNDSTFEIANPTDDLVAYYRRLTKCNTTFKNNFSKSGFYICKDNNVYMAIDGGPIGPDYLPAHAHADIFSYELSLFSRRIIVDSGVYEYPAGEMRSYVRATKAHNTVSIDDIDQAECWGSFRVARRFPPENVTFTQENNYYRFQGIFSGYASLIGDKIVHKRQIIYDSGGRSILVDDYVFGKGKHKVKSYIHFNPDVKIQYVDNIIVLTLEKRKIKLIVEYGQYHLEHGWYCPRFGEKVQNQVLVISADSIPAQLSYHISF